MIEEAFVRKPDKKNVVLEFAVASKDIADIEFLKDGQTVQSTSEGKANVSAKKYSITQKVIEQKNETLVQLEIEDASVKDIGEYEIVVKNKQGQSSSKKLSVSETEIITPEPGQVEADESIDIEEDMAKSEGVEVKKKKKKIVKKKKKKEEEAPVNPPEVVSFLRNLVRKPVMSELPLAWYQFFFLLLPFR